MKKLDEAITTFFNQQDYQSYRRLRDLVSSCKHLSERIWQKFDNAVLIASKSYNTKLAKEAILDLRLVKRRDKKVADAILRGLMSSSRALRQAAWAAVSNRTQAMNLLSHLEQINTKQLMVWEVLMAIDWMANYLRGKRYRERLVKLVRRLEQTPTRSRSLRWKIEDTLYAPMHLNQHRP